MRTITAISCAIIGVSVLSFSGARAAKDSQSLSGRMASQQGRKSGQGRNAKGLRHAVPRGRHCCTAGPVQHDHKRRACAGRRRLKTAKACRDEWRANKDANQAKGVTEKAYVTQCRAGGRSQRRPPWLRHPPRRREQQRHHHRLPAAGSYYGSSERLRQRLRVQTSMRARAGSLPLRQRYRCLGQSGLKDLSLHRATRNTARRSPARTCANRMRQVRPACRQKREASLIVYGPSKSALPRINAEAHDGLLAQ